MEPYQLEVGMKCKIHSNLIWEIDHLRGINPDEIYLIVSVRPITLRVMRQDGVYLNLHRNWVHPIIDLEYECI